MMSIVYICNRMFTSPPLFVLTKYFGGFGIFSNLRNIWEINFCSLGKSKRHRPRWGRHLQHLQEAQPGHDPEQAEQGPGHGALRSHRAQPEIVWVFPLNSLQILQDHKLRTQMNTWLAVECNLRTFELKWEPALHCQQMAAEDILCVKYNYTSW